MYCCSLIGLQDSLKMTESRRPVQDANIWDGRKISPDERNQNQAVTLEDFYSDTVSSFSLLNSDLKKKMWGRGTFCSVNRALGGAGEGAAGSIAPKSASFQCPLVAAARRCIPGRPGHGRWPRGKAEPEGHGERDSSPPMLVGPAGCLGTARCMAVSRPLCLFGHFF